MVAYVDYFKVGVRFTNYQKKIRRKYGRYIEWRFWSRGRPQREREDAAARTSLPGREEYPIRNVGKGIMKGVDSERRDAH